MDLVKESSSCIRSSEPIEWDKVCCRDRSTSSIESRDMRYVPRMVSTVRRGLREVRRAGRAMSRGFVTRGAARVVEGLNKLR